MHRGDGVVSWFAVLGPGVYRGGPRGPDSAGAIREAVSEEQQERFQRCGRDRRSGRPGEHALRAAEDDGATRVAGAAPGAPAVHRRAHGRSQSDARAAARARDRDSVGRRYSPVGDPPSLTTQSSGYHLGSLLITPSTAPTVARPRCRDCPGDARADRVGRSIGAVSSGGDGAGDRSDDRHSDRRGGREWAHVRAWTRHGRVVGIVPRQYSTGGKPTLGRISKRGNTYLRQLFIQGAQASSCP